MLAAVICIHYTYITNYWMCLTLLLSPKCQVNMSMLYMN